MTSQSQTLNRSFIRSNSQDFAHHLLISFTAIFPILFLQLKILTIGKREIPKYRTIT